MDPGLQVTKVQRTFKANRSKVKLKLQSLSDVNISIHICTSSFQFYLIVYSNII